MDRTYLDIAHGLIGRSIRRDEHVHYMASDETTARLVAEALAEECDDCVTENDGERDHWGTRDGCDWRVGVRCREWVEDFLQW